MKTVPKTLIENDLRGYLKELKALLPYSFVNQLSLLNIEKPCSCALGIIHLAAPVL